MGILIKDGLFSSLKEYLRDNRISKKISFSKNPTLSNVKYTTDELRGMKTMLKRLYNRLNYLQALYESRVAGEEVKGEIENLQKRIKTIYKMIRKVSNSKSYYF